MKYLFYILFIFAISFSEYASSEEPNSASDSKSRIWNLTAAMIFRDEAPYLKEWIEYNKLIGVEHFILYNNLSSDHYLEVLTPYINSGEVELIEWSFDYDNHEGWLNIQCSAYNDAIIKSKNRSKWLALIDSDEFLVPKENDNIQNIIKKYDRKQIGAIEVQWVNFGTSGVKKIPEDKLMIETLLLNGGPDIFYKSIVRPTKVSICISAHFCILQEPFIRKVVSLKEIQLNHYWSRDEYYLYNFKIPRRAFFGQPASAVLEREKTFNRHTEYGISILRFIPALREKMAL